MWHVVRWCSREQRWVSLRGPFASEALAQDAQQCVDPWGTLTRVMFIK